MPNIKTSVSQKKLKGTFRTDRHNTDAPVSSETLGSAPSHMSDEEKAIWKEIAANLPLGIATRADSLAFEVLVSLMSRFRTEGLSGTELTLLMRSFGKFGLSPAERGNVEPIPPKKGPSKWG